jgi:hypothetical protein
MVVDAAPLFIIVITFTTTAIAVIINAN